MGHDSKKDVFKNFVRAVDLLEAVRKARALDPGKELDAGQLAAVEKDAVARVQRALAALAGLAGEK